MNRSRDFKWALSIYSNIKKDQEKKKAKQDLDQSKKRLVKPNSANPYSKPNQSSYFHSKVTRKGKEVQIIQDLLDQTKGNSSVFIASEKPYLSHSNSVPFVKKNSEIAPQVSFPFQQELDPKKDGQRLDSGVTDSRLIVRTSIDQNPRPSKSSLPRQNNNSKVVAVSGSTPSKSQDRRKSSLKRQNLVAKEQYITYFIDYGNNSPLVKRVFKSRPWLTEIHVPQLACIRWKPTSNGINFRNLGKNCGIQKQVVNHFEFHDEITTKSNLYSNLAKYAQKQQFDLQQLVPKTYLIRLNKLHFQSDFDLFIHVFQEQEEKVYLLKPPDLNQGQGISLFYSIDQLRELIKTYVNSLMNSHSSNYADNLGQIIIQKYIQEPFLIDGRKFDFRVWVLIDQKFTLYWYREGYLRLASLKYSIATEVDLNNLFIHLTNHAVQKHHSDYCKFEEGNQMGFADLQNYLTRTCDKPDLMEKYIIPQMKWLIIMCLKSVAHKIDRFDRNFCFEIFGFDFLLDSSHKLHLIEVNTNPSLEETCALLKMLIPRMITNIEDDALRLTIDKVFPFSQPDANDMLAKFPLLQYSDKENLWQAI